MILAVLPRSPETPPPRRLPAILAARLDGPAPAAVLVLGCGDLAAPPQAPDLSAIMLDAARPGLAAAGAPLAAQAAAIPRDRFVLLDLAGATLPDAQGVIAAAGWVWSRLDQPHRGLLVACHEIDTLAVARLVAAGFLIGPAPLTARQRARVAGRLRRRAALLRWLGPVPALLALGRLAARVRRRPR